MIFGFNCTWGIGLNWIKFHIFPQILDLIRTDDRFIVKQYTVNFILSAVLSPKNNGENMQYMPYTMTKLASQNLQVFSAFTMFYVSQVEENWKTL